MRQKEINKLIEVYVSMKIKQGKRNLGLLDVYLDFQRVDAQRIEKALDKIFNKEEADSK